MGEENVPLQQDRKARGADVQIDTAVMALFAQCLEAYHAYNDLDQLAEDLRILSLNAELAAGRAGERGRAVRALTQYTRALVNRLESVKTEVFASRSITYAASAAVFRDLDRLHLVDVAIATAGETVAAEAKVARALMDAAVEEEKTPDLLLTKLGQLLVSVRSLADNTGQVLEIVSQSGSIATNIAIEAASAGQYEMEFRTVADTMRRYVLMLRSIVDKASAAVRSASQSGDALQRLATRSVH
ncbi:MAG: chemotaxis protein [Alphaproteobacteria bacterium]|nr:chemotaxis protein [Alphaproteobacteria bacterium]